MTGELQRAAWRAGILPPVEQVRPGLWSVPVPIPDNPLRYVLVYVLHTPHGAAVVDAGWDSEESWSVLVAGLARAGLKPADVHTILVTHMHPDHFGLAPRLREASGAVLAMHAADAALVAVRSPEQKRAVHRAGREQLVGLGAGEELIEGDGSIPIPRLPPDRAPERLLEDGEALGIEGWGLRAVWTPGHTPGHLCFADSSRDLLFTGDHVLPRISPHVGVTPLQQADPLGSYLRSLRALAERGEQDEVLPAHEYRFRGLGSRVSSLVEHHEERLEELRTATLAAPGATALELAHHLSWSRPLSTMAPRLRRMALRETYAHLVVLVARGQVRGEGTAPVRWFADPRAAVPGVRGSRQVVITVEETS